MTKPKTLCRNRRHPLTDRRPKRTGGSECRGCRRDEIAYRNMTKPLGVDTTVDPAVAAEQRRWLANWQDGIDATIARIRAESGFDGTQRGWQTLGECLLPGPAPSPKKLTVIRGRRVVHCERCGAPRWRGDACASCAVMQEQRRAAS